MTEDEAKTKWCHMRPPLAGQGTADKPCIGSQRMAWRWKDITEHGHQMQVLPNPTEYSETEGFCGLAGKP